MKKIVLLVIFFLLFFILYDVKSFSCWESYWNNFIEFSDIFWRKKCVKKEYTSILWNSMWTFVWWHYRKYITRWDYSVVWNTYINGILSNDFYPGFFWQWHTLWRKWMEIWAILNNEPRQKVWVVVYLKVNEPWEYIISWSADDFFTVKINWINALNNSENLGAGYYILPVYLNKWDNYLEFFYEDRFWWLQFLSWEIVWPFPVWTFINNSDNTLKTVNDFKSYIYSLWNITHITPRWGFTVNWPKWYIDKIIWNTRHIYGKSWITISDHIHKAWLYCPDWYHPWLLNPNPSQSWKAFTPDTCIKYTDITPEEIRDYILRNNPYDIDWFFIKTENINIWNTEKTSCPSWFSFPKDNSIYQSNVTNFHCITPDPKIHKNIKKTDRYIVKVWQNSWLTSCWHWSKVISFDKNTMNMTCERSFLDLDWLYLQAFKDKEIYLYSYNKWLKNEYAEILEFLLEKEEDKRSKNFLNWIKWRYIWNISMKNVSSDSYSDDLSGWNYRTYDISVNRLCIKDSVLPSRRICSEISKLFRLNIYAKNMVVNAWNTSINSNNFTNWSLIADWKTNVLSYKPLDEFWNYILPVKKQNWEKIRDLSFRINYNNTLYANQYNKNWPSGIKSTNFYNYTEDWSNSSLLGIGQNLNFSKNNIDDTNIKDWQYKIAFKTYSPTYYENTNDGRQYAYWNVELKTPTIKLSDYPTPFSLWWNLDLQFKPKIVTSIDWSIINQWFVVWARQDSNLQITKTNWSIWNFNNWNILLEYWKMDWNQKNPHTNLDLNFLKSWSWTKISSWNQRNSSSLTQSWLNTIWRNNFSTLLRQIWKIAILDNKTYLATHVKDVIDWVEIVYSSFAIWLKNYEKWEEQWGNNAFQRRIKIIWKIHNPKRTKVYEWEEILELWNISKAELQKFVRKAVFDNIRNLNTNKNWNTLVNLSNLTWNWWIKIWNTIYFEKNNWENIEISWNYTWLKNIVIYWWNAYITWNIKAWNKTNDILSIISIEKNWKGWNIYIKPSVNEINSVMYADRAVLSYDWTKELDPDNWWTYELLKNQLYIYGSVFSNNTIWGSVSNPLKCPFYERNCDLGKAEKYDFYNLRRWYENLYKTWTKPYVTWNLKPENVWSDLEYTLIIEYNPLIQSEKIPFFQIKK